ncbi:hypothetical protein CYY_010592, partial [Polysphondylium violaceum]
NFIINTTNNDDNQIFNHLPKGPSFIHWFSNYLLNYYQLKSSKNTATTSFIDIGSQETVLKWFDQYKSNSYTVLFFGRPMIFTKDIEVSKYVLSNQNIDSFTKPPDESGVMIKLAKNSILISEGDNWRHHRSIISPPFSSINIKSMVPSILLKVDQFLNFIKKNNHGSLDIHSCSTKLTFDIIGLLSMGYDFNSFNSENDKGSISSKQFDFILNEMIRPIRRFSRFIKLPSDFKLFKYLKQLDQIISNAISSRKLILNNNIEDGIEYKKNYLLDYLIQNNIDEKEIIGNINTFLLAGHETSANLLTFIFYLLSIHKDIQDSIYNEIKNIENIDSIPPVIEWVINETLRLFPPAPMIGRSSTKQDILPNGIKIPKDTLILVSVYALQRDSKIWKDPNNFNPYRWRECKNVEEFIPFSSGARICVGQKFALLEAKIIIFKLLKQFKLEYDEKPNYPFTIYQRATLTPKYPVNLLFSSRKQ